MKALFDLLPIICFFATYKLAGSHTSTLSTYLPVAENLIPIVAATIVIVVTSLLQMGWILIKGEKPSKMAIFSTGLVVIFGGLTIFLQKPEFIQWKPTILYWLFAGILFIGRLRNKIYLKTVFQGIEMPLGSWKTVENWTLLFLVAVGIINLVVAYTCSMDVWVDFKLFGLLGLTLLFTIGLGVYIAKYAQVAQNTNN